MPLIYDLTGFYELCFRPYLHPSTSQQANQLEITPNKKYLAAAGNPHIKLFELASNNPNAVRTTTQIRPENFLSAWNRPPQ
jgi:hypothetical protein